MRLLSGIMIAAVLWPLLLLVTAAPANADPAIARTWHSDSLRDNAVGYWFEVRPVAGSDDAYVGTLRFTHRDGRRGSTTPISLTVDGTRMMMRARQGSFDRSSGPLRGVMNAAGTEVRLTNCQARLRLVMANDLASDCTFRPA
jgi:hypothetical protein